MTKHVVAVVAAAAMVFAATAGCGSSEDPGYNGTYQEPNNPDQQPVNPDEPGGDSNEGDHNDEHDVCDIHDPSSPCGGGLTPEPE